MLSVVYIALCFLTGLVFTKVFFKNIKKLAVYNENGIERKIPTYFVMLPAMYVTGTLVVTWTVYLSAYLFKAKDVPLFYGNIVSMGLWGIVIIAWFLMGLLNKKIKIKGQDIADFFYGDTVSFNVFTIIVVAFVSYLMYLTLNVRNGNVNVGYSVFSDFAPHLGMIRSFSRSNNFPTQYAHFAGEDIKYHFMFQFFVGNLEFLGMRIDHAFNIPSILNMVSVYFLLVVLTLKIFGSRATAYVASLLFTFRSAMSVFKYFAGLRSKNFFDTIKNTTDFFNYTEHEDWGLWNLNVYANQRHLCFGIAAMMIAILMFLSYLERTEDVLTLITDDGEKIKRSFISKIRLIFFTKEAWSIADIKLSVGLGLMLGLLAFWHGSAVIGCLSILFFMAAFSQNRIDYIITAIMAVGFSFLQTRFFIDGQAVSPTYYFGFLAQNKTIFGVLLYIFELTGIVILIAILGATMVRGVKRYMLLCLSIPFVMSFFLSLTPDVTVNHKWIMISLMFLSMYAAYFTVNLFKNRDWFNKCIAIVLVICLTLSGIFEFSIVIKRNRNYIVLSETSPVTEWVSENATCEDIFLTPWYSLNEVVMGGAMLYYGWPYYAYSAGYDTSFRQRVVKMIYEADAKDLVKLCRNYNIRYIIIDRDARTSSEYRVNEAGIEATFREVFSNDTGDWAFRIFDTYLPN